MLPIQCSTIVKEKYEGEMWHWHRMTFSLATEKGDQIGIADNFPSTSYDR